MSEGRSVKYSLPDVASPFTTVQRLVNAEGQPERNRPHYHPDTIEICAVARGQLDWFLADEAFAVQPGEIVVVPANVVHGAIDSNLQPCEILAVHLAPEQLPPRLAEAVADLRPQRFRQPDVAILVARIVDAHEQRTTFLAEVVAALGTLLVAGIVAREESEEEANSSRLIRQAKRAMLGEGGVRPTLQQVADRLGVSTVWLHKLFVRETGAAPGDWARARRLSEAKRMLEDGRHSTVDIAMRLGYSTGQAFATAFRKESGMTPSEYRTLHSPQDSERERRIYRVEMRETWVDDVRIYPPS